MPTYTITIQNDMKQQFCIEAKNVSDLLEKSKGIYKDNMVTADNDNGEQRHRPLSTIPKTVNKRIPMNKSLLYPETKKRPEIVINIDDIPD
jgi:hypothetical protein